MDDRRPLLLIDVDGVLNPFSNPSTGFEELRIDGMPVRLSKRHGEWLRSLSAAYELVWATTWEADANEHIGSVLGLPPLRHITFTPAPPGFEGWTQKLPDVITFVGDRRAAWIDDRFGDGERQWARERTAAGIPTLLVEVDGQVGLTTQHIEELRRFVAAPTSATFGCSRISNRPTPADVV